MEAIPGYPGYVWDRYPDTSVKMPTYLVAYMVSEYQEVASIPTANGIPHSTWSRPDAIADNLTAYTVSITPSVLQHLEDRIGVPYGLPKMDQISYPSLSGAMENYGLVTYEELDLLIDENESTQQDKVLIANVIGHEFAHMWTGNWVTCAWYS